MIDNIDFDLWSNIKEEMKTKPLVDQILIFVYAEQSIGETNDIINEFKNDHSIVEIEASIIMLVQQGALALDLKGYE